MKNIYRSILTVALGVAAFSASAQDLDPTVVVDRAYEGKLMEVHKPLLEMAVPDTVMRFDLDFDYSVFERPYKGSYEFNPYLLSMKPAASGDPSGKFYLRAGAGYQLRPELDVVWSPNVGTEKFRMDVYASHRSYIGNYRNPVKPADVLWKGYDMDSKAGVVLGCDWNTGSMGIDVGYYGLHQRDRRWDRGYNGLDASFGIGSKDMWARGFVYDFRADYRLASDVTKMNVNSSDVRRFGENVLDVSLKAGAGLKENSWFRVDAGLALAAYSGDFKEAAADVYITPRYLYRKGIFSADLGVKVSKLIGKMLDEPTMDASGSVFMFDAKEQIVYPDVEVRLNLFPKFLAFFVKADGGNRIESNASLLEKNHFTNVSVWHDMGVSVERVAAKAGFDGSIGSRFSYALYGGYTNYASGVLDAVCLLDGCSDGIGSAPCLKYMPYQKLYASLEWLWKGESFAADGNVTYTDAFGAAFDPWTLCLAPAAFTGDVSFEYNYKRRVFVGLDCEFSSARKDVDKAYLIPGYADLGLSLEYMTARNISFWLKGGNLLGMAIQKNPFYAVKGPYFTLGICLNL